MYFRSMQGNSVDDRMDCISLLLFSCAFPVKRARKVEEKIRGMIYIYLDSLLVRDNVHISSRKGSYSG